MSEEKNALEQVVAAIQKLLGFGSAEEITGAVNKIVDANNDEAGILDALKGLFGDAIPQADLSSVVQGFLGKGSIGLDNVLDVFTGIGEKVGGFDKVAGLVGLASNAGKVTDAVKSVSAGKVTDAVKSAAGAATDTAKDAAANAVDAVEGAAGAVGGGAREAKAAVGEAADAILGDVKQVAAEPAKKRKKWPIVVGVIAAVVALAGAGMWIWHENPTFCNTMCHTSMNAYVQTYEQVAGQPGVDKYGNEVSDSHAMLVVSHKDYEVECLQCHQPAITQQIGEVMETITGNYTVLERNNGDGYALHEVSLAELMENGKRDASNNGDAFCLNESCHNFTRDTLTAATESMAFNPHRAQHGEIACGECHKSHRASVFYCTQCHSEAAESLPDGWLTYSEAQDMIPS